MENTSTNANDIDAIINKQEIECYRNKNKKESLASFTISSEKRNDNIKNVNHINNISHDRYNDNSNDCTIPNSINILKTGLSNEERNKMIKKLSTKLQYLNNENKSINKSKINVSYSNFNKKLHRTSNDANNANKNSTTQVFKVSDNNLIASNSNNNDIKTNNLSNNILINKKKILVVDDSPSIRKAVVNLIQTVFNSEDNYIIIEGKDGIDIVNNLLSQEDNGDKEQIEYVFSDENMEYLNGSKAFSIINDLIKLRYGNNSLKLISITGIDNKEEMDVIYKRGANYVLPKPLGINNLKQLKSEIEALI